MMTEQTKTQTMFVAMELAVTDWTPEQAHEHLSVTINEGQVLDNMNLQVVDVGPVSIADLVQVTFKVARGYDHSQFQKDIKSIYDGDATDEQIQNVLDNVVVV